MPFDSARPRSKRSRYRSKLKAFFFLFKDGRIIEETTGHEVPSPRPIFATGKVPAPEHRTDGLYFHLDGRPMFEETRQILHKWFCKYLFVIDGRLRPEIRPPDQSFSGRDWNVLLQNLGHGTDAGLQTWESRQETDRSLTRTGSPNQTRREATDAEENHAQENVAALRLWKNWIGSVPDAILARPRVRRSLLRIPRSDWRRTLEARLAVIFDRDPSDAAIRKMAEILSRDEGWHLWTWEPELQPLYKQAFNDKDRWALVSMLEMMAFRRANRARDRRSATAPFRVCFRTASGTYTFALPRRPLGGHGRTTVRICAFVFAAHQIFAKQRTIDIRILAAATWKAGRFLEEPAVLGRGHLTLHRVAAHFGLTPRRVSYAALKLRAGADALMRSSEAQRSDPSPEA